MPSPHDPKPTRQRHMKLKPAGHSATIEALIQPAIVVGSTLMSTIAAYVLALDEITHALAAINAGRAPAPSDLFVIALCAGMGFLVDMAIIVSATRYKMHAVRNAPSEARWLTLAKWVLGLGLASETMTLFSFFVHLDPTAFPGWLIAFAGSIHSILAIARAFLPPVVIAYFAAGVLPVMFDRADRNREIKSRTSSNIMLLIDRLSEVFDTDDKAEMLRALGGQLMLDTYATYDETARTNEDEQLRRDAKLLAHLARIHRLDWDTIAADVAPALALGHEGDATHDRVETSLAAAPALTAAPERPELPEEPEPTPPPGASASPRISVRSPDPEAGSATATAFTLPATPVRPARRTRTGGSVSPNSGASSTGVATAASREEIRARREQAARAILIKLGPTERRAVTNAQLARQIAMRTQAGCSEHTARLIRVAIERELAGELTGELTGERPAKPPFGFEVPEHVVHTEQEA